jgi:glycosyltransferase involved in cell wall biosynthesis
MHAYYGKLRKICESHVNKAGVLYCRVRDGLSATHLGNAARRLKERVSRVLRTPSARAAPAGSSVPLLNFGALVGHTLGERGKVSIVLPVYNQVSMLQLAMRSALAQTYRNIELIVVNDGSTDGVEEILELYADDPRVILLTQRNQKLPSALNNGFEWATGEFFTWTSADNLMRPRQIEILLAHLAEHTDEVMVYSDYQAIDDSGAPLRDPTFRPQNQDPKDASLMRLPDRLSEARFHDSGDNYLGASFLYRRDAARMVGQYAENAFGGEDYDYWLRMHALGPIGHVAEILYDYRVHSNTLNAKAKELGLFGNIRGLLERDSQRRAFMKRLPRFVGVGVSAQSMGDGPEVLLFRHSVRSDPRVLERLGRREVLAICVVDVELTDIDRESLARADLILVSNPRIQRWLEPWRRYDTFLLDPDADRDLFVRLTQLRAFDKQHTPRTTKPRARTYHVAEPLRVGIQVDGLHQGGMEQTVSDLARNLDSARVELTLLVNGHEPGDAGVELEREGFRLVQLKGNEARLAETVREHRVEVVSLHHSVFGLPVYRRAGVGTCYTVHSSYTWFDSEELDRRRVALREIDLFLAVSHQVQQYFVGKFDVDPARVRVVPNGLDSRHLDGAAPADRAALGLRPDDYVFIHVGSFNRVKHNNLLLAAFREVARKAPKARLLMVGNPADPAFLTEIRQRIAAWGFGDRVRVLSWVPRREVASLLRAADAFLLPSLQEGWSIAAMEAMHAGLPLVLSDTGSAREVIRDNDVGIVIPNPYRRLEDVSSEDLVAYSKVERPVNTYALVAAMLEMMENATLWRAKGRAGLAKVGTEFHIRTMAERYYEAFMEVRHVHAKRARHYWVRCGLVQKTSKTHNL